MHQPVMGVIGFGALMAWGVYRRVRRNIGRQPLRPKRTIFRLVMLCLACVLIGLTGFIFPRILLGFGPGLLCGAILGFFGLKLTRFETTEEGHFYTPDTRIGVALSLLLVARIIYRMIVLGNTDYLAAGHPQAMQSPLTYFIIGLTIGYYIVYSIGLFVHTHDKKPLPPASSI